MHRISSEQLAVVIATSGVLVCILFKDSASRFDTVRVSANTAPAMRAVPTSVTGGLVHYDGLQRYYVCIPFSGTLNVAPPTDDNLRVKGHTSNPSDFTFSAVYNAVIVFRRQIDSIVTVPHRIDSVRSGFVQSAKAAKSVGR